MSTPERRAQDLLEQVSGTGIPDAHLLCDRHDPQAVAFTVVEQHLYQPPPRAPPAALPWRAAAPPPLAAPAGRRSTGPTLGRVRRND